MRPNCMCGKPGKIIGKLKNGNTKYTNKCSSCIRLTLGYKKYRKNYCEKCNFIAEHICQLDIDHIDGNHNNNDESNLQTLCANCHRLKTHLNKDNIKNK